jgi:hypothetical protein
VKKFVASSALLRWNSKAVRADHDRVRCAGSFTGAPVVGEWKRRFRFGIPAKLAK